MASQAGSPYNRSQYRQARARFLRNAGNICAICLGTIDRTLSGRNPWGATVDHHVPTSYDPAGFWRTDNWRIVHRKCNERKGDRHPDTIPEALTHGLTAQEAEQWRERGLFPGASKQWCHAAEYDGLPVPDPPPAWWPPTDEPNEWNCYPPPVATVTDISW